MLSVHLLWPWFEVPQHLVRIRCSLNHTHITNDPSTSIREWVPFSDHPHKALKSPTFLQTEGKARHLSTEVTKELTIRSDTHTQVGRNIENSSITVFSMGDRPGKVERLAHTIQIPSRGEWGCMWQVAFWTKYYQNYQVMIFSFGHPLVYHVFYMHYDRPSFYSFTTCKFSMPFHRPKGRWKP